MLSRLWRVASSALTNMRFGFIRENASLFSGMINGFLIRGLQNFIHFEIRLSRVKLWSRRSFPSKLRK